jgi:hypothetical protein
MIGTKWIEFGTFELPSGRLVIGDPCYRQVGKSGLNTVVGARRGTWRVCYAATDSAPGALQAVHSFVAPDVLRWVEADHPIAVDSAQVGLVDERFYRPDNQRWYERCCKLSCNPPFAGTFPAGAVSATYYGDGDYPLLLARGADGDIVGVRVLFLDPVEAYAVGDGREDHSSPLSPRRRFELVPPAPA